MIFQVFSGKIRHEPTYRRHCEKVAVPSGGTPAHIPPPLHGRRKSTRKPSDYDASAIIKLQNLINNHSP